MKIAILTSGILPVPAVQGGAVENLTDFYLDYNERHQLHHITVYSVWHPAVEHHPALRSSANRYVFIKTATLAAKIRRRLMHMLHSEREYYHYSVEYYLDRALRRMRHDGPFDVILMENRPGYALRLQGNTSARLVYHLHNEKLSLNTPKHQEILAAASRVITVSNYISGLVKAIDPATDKCVTLHNGIDLTVFNPQVTAARPDLFTPDDFVLVFSGRVNQEKGILELVQAMNLLKNHPDIKLMVIGSSFYGNADNENSFAQQLKEVAAPLGNRIVFTGFISYADMPRYLKMAHVAVIPSVWDDPFPTTVLEAQAMGLPIISTRRGGIPEEVTSENAILLNTDEHFVSNLADAILTLYEHPEKREQMSEAALQRSRLFNKERYTQEFFARLEEAVALS